MKREATDFVRYWPRGDAADVGWYATLTPRVHSRRDCFYS